MPAPTILECYLHPNLINYCIVPYLLPDIQVARDNLEQLVSDFHGLVVVRNGNEPLLDIRDRYDIISFKDYWLHMTPFTSFRMLRELRESKLSRREFFKSISSINKSILN